MSLGAKCLVHYGRHSIQKTHDAIFKVDETALRADRNCLVQSETQEQYVQQLRQSQRRANRLRKAQHTTVQWQLRHMSERGRECVCAAVQQSMTCPVV